MFMIQTYILELFIGTFPFLLAIIALLQLATFRINHESVHQMPNCYGCMGEEANVDLLFAQGFIHRTGTAGIES